MVTGPSGATGIIGPGGQTVMNAQGVVQTTQMTGGTQQMMQVDPNAVGQPRPQFQRMTSLPNGQKIIQPPGQVTQMGGQTIQTRYVTIDGNPLNAEQVRRFVLLTFNF